MMAVSPVEPRELRARWLGPAVLGASLLACASGCGGSDSTGTHSSTTTVTTGSGTGSGTGGDTGGGTSSGTGGAGGTPTVTPDCTLDDDCAPGSVCTSGACTPGCTASHGCAGSQACCGTTCVDLSQDVSNCGACGKTCTLDHAVAACSAGACVVATCEAGFGDCDQDPSTGCEAPDVGGQTACACTPGSAADCYTGPAGTEGVGTCKGGQKTCASSGTSFGPCDGEVLPSPDVCTDSFDNDCNGVVNDGFITGEAGCVCVPGEIEDCYTGPANTLNVGVCQGGTKTCTGDGYGPCIGEVTPAVDDCTDSLDNDCNGVVNDGFAAGGAGCACTPNDVKFCYSGPTGTLWVGVCTNGNATCASDGTAWGSCVGEIVPSEDSCLDGVDNDCNGVADDGNHLAPGCACTPGATKCESGYQLYCDANGDWGPPAGPCVCVPGQFSCNCDEVMMCDAGPPAKWVPKAPSLICPSTQRCDSATGTCKALTAIGSTTPTGTYYQFATFTTTNSVFKGGYDVDSYGDYIYVNRGGTNLDVYQVTLLDSDGDGLLEPNQHPSDPQHQGPMEQRTLTFIGTYTKATDLAPVGPASTSEIYVTSDAVYSLGPTRNGDITRWDLTTHTNTIVANSTATVLLSFLGFGSVDQTWYGGVESYRQVYSFCSAKNMWVPEFAYPSLAGGHMDGLEVVTNPTTGIQYVYVSDMTSDFLAQYRRDNNGGWVQENLFKYADATGSSVEGMGFGALNHFWVTGGGILYEIGGGDISNYVP